MHLQREPHHGELVPSTLAEEPSLEDPRPGDRGGYASTNTISPNTCFSFEIAALHYGEINTEGRWVVLDAASAPMGGRSRDNESSLGATPFAGLLGATVESFSLSPPLVFELALSSGVRVRFYDDSDIYESAHIRPGGYLI